LQESSTITFGKTQDGHEQHRALRDSSGQEAQDF
jgi:hypothetical protein